MKRSEAAFPAAVLALAAAMLALGYFHYRYSWSAFAFPLAAGIALSLLCALEIASILRGRAARAPEEPDPPALSVAGVAWLFALGPFLYGLGFVFGPALYLLVCLRGNRFSWRLSLGTAVASLIVTWGLFIKVIGVQMPVRPPWMDW